ncbi:MAG: cytidine deaminase [Actinomycetota bacterium]|nr:cytidine deaminase [Actinomycetota bacterium]MDA8117045.1 cytidine deaminase [Actinomycetota bacterium]
MIDASKIDRLLRTARAARGRAYAPYSDFAVGAALLGTSGRIYAGTNIENSSYGLSLCAERTALAQAIVRGERSFRAVAVVADSDDPCTPCGACRHVLSEFQDDLIIVSANLHGAVETRPLKELLPARNNTLKRRRGAS